MRAAFDTQRARTADGILEQFEGQDFAECQITESRSLVQVAPVKEDVPAIGKPDETMSLPQHERHDAARVRWAALLCRSSGRRWTRRPAAVGHADSVRLRDLFRPPPAARLTP